MPMISIELNAQPVSSLERLRLAWDLTDHETASLFAVRTEAAMSWDPDQVPGEHRACLVQLEALLEEMSHRVTLRVMPRAVRMPLEDFSGRSLLDLACVGQVDEARRAASTIYTVDAVNP